MPHPHYSFPLFNICYWCAECLNEPKKARSRRCNVVSTLPALRQHIANRRLWDYSRDKTELSLREHDHIFHCSHCRDVLGVCLSCSSSRNARRMLELLEGKKKQSASDRVARFSS